VFTPSRPLPALAGLCVGGAVAVWPRYREPIGRTGVVALGVVAVLLAVAGAGLASRLDAVTFDSLEKRLSLKSRHRVAQHRVALGEFAAHPVVGTGPGRAVLRWRDDDRMLRARFVHNEYLQVAVELGTVGALLLIAVLAATGHAVWKGRSAGGMPWAGVAAAVVATAVHGALDFVWHMPVIPFVVLLLAGTATVPAEQATDYGGEP
jgi:O-antigen ligase